MFKDNYIVGNLHLQSTLGELNLYDIKVDINSKTSEVCKILYMDSVIPGIIISNNDQSAFISRKQVFESLSKPYGVDLFLKKPLKELMEILDETDRLIFPSSMLIVTAVQKVLEQSYEKFDYPILVEFENKKLKFLSIYQLLVAHSEINRLAFQALKDASDFKTELLSIAAHDLKNPLNSIRSLSKLLLEMNGNSQHNNHEFAEQIYESANHMFNLISELLNSTVIQAGKIKLKKQIMDVNEIISAIIYQNKNLAESKEQFLIYDVDNEMEYVTDGDTLKLRESFENLISNAIKYSPFNSEINLSLKKTDDLLIFSVKDNGPGFTDEDKEKLFQKFQRLSALPTAGESSTGLGLYIAKQIIDLHDGKIWLESEYGKGSTFHIELKAEEI